MSEQQAETEVVTGVIGGITQKRADTWQVAVRPGGSQYDKNLWTKNAELVAALSSRIGEGETFTCNVSYWTNQSQQQVRSLWIHALGGEVAAPAVATASPAGQSTPKYQNDPSPESQKRMDQHQLRELKAQAWRVTAELFSHEDVPDMSGAQALYGRLKAFQTLVYSDIAGDLLTHQDAESVPFGDEPSVPFD